MRASGTKGSGATPAPRARWLLFARAVAWLVVLLYVVGMAAIFFLERRLGFQDETSVEDLIIFVGFGMFAVVGALLVAKRPDNVIGWILSAASLVVGVAACESYAAYVMTTRGRPDALAVAGAWANSWYWLLFLGLVFVYLPLLFPDGRLLSRRWLPVAVVPGIGLAAMVVLGALAETLRGQDVEYEIDNPIGIEGLAHVEELPVIFVFGGLFAAGAIGAVVSLVARFRRSRGIERQQLKWFLYAAAPVPIAPFSDQMPAVIDVVTFGWVFLGLPTAIGIAVLRYRLYDIDLVINRTLVYGALTLFLALVYVGGVALLQTLFRGFTGGTSQLAVVASTLTIAALFNPLRRRIQYFIDRRFYRRKYDAARTLAAFSTRLRDETELVTLADDLLAVVRETVQPAHVTLWLRKPKAEPSLEERHR